MAYPLQFHENPYIHYLVVTKRAQTVINGELHRLGMVRLVMRMRRGSWLMSISYLATLSVRNGGINECMEFGSTRWDIDRWHSYQTKFYYFSFSSSVVTKRVQTLVGYGWVELDLVRLC
jgi:hypothetical protein